MKAAPTAALILAAGASTRMGRPKALLAIGGKTFVEAILGTARAGGVEALCVVLGPPHGDEIRARLPAGCQVAWNAAPERGMLSSIQAGIAALHNDICAALVWPVDQPLVAVETIRRLVDAPADAIAAPQHGARGGHPVRIPRSYFAELLSLPVEAGLRGLLRAHAEAVLRLEVGDLGAITDVDTPEDYERMAEDGDGNGNGNGDGGGIDG